MAPSVPCDRFEPGVNPHRCAKCDWVKGRHKRKKPICATTGKKRYQTAAAARVSLHRYLANPKEPIAFAQKLMVYPCEACRGFHIGHHADGDDNVAVSRPRPKKAEVRA